MKRAILTAILVVIILTACHADRMSTDYPSLGDKGTDKKILVAGEMSDFRYDVIKKVAGHFPDYLFEVTDFGGAKDRDLETYHAVIVVDQVEAWMLFNGGAKRLMDRAEPHKVIPFITAGDPDWGWTDKSTGIEAVTGPSEEPRKDGIVEELKMRLDGILAN